MKKIILFIGIILIGVGIYFSFDSSKKEVQEKIIALEDKDVEKSIFKKYYSKAIKTVDKMSLDEKVGQLFLVRYEKEKTSSQANYYPGGYILFARDFENHTKDSIKSELKKLNELNKYPLVLGVDEEGGFVTRVSRFKAFREEAFKAPKDYYLEGGYKLLEEKENEKLSLLKELGLNLNLAPVADLSVNKDDFIYNRAFGEDKDKTSEYITNMVKYANNNKINSCLKHFPGYGNNKDTHTGIAIDERSYETFENEDYLPFKAGIKENVPTILVSHNIVKAMDDKYPASLSKKVITELREKLKFSGIIMTDDLEMEAVKSYVAEGKAATMAINAGNDMIITSDFESMKDEVINSYNNKEITDETLNKAVIRIISWKYYSNIM